MEKKTIRFLICSAIAALICCIVVFTVMISRMRNENRNSINQVCKLYMSEMSYQIEAHFRSIMDLRLAMEQGIIRRYPPDQVEEYSQEMIDELILGGNIRSFTYLALYSEDGEKTVIYGEAVDSIDEAAFFRSLKEGKEKVASSVKPSGETMLLFGTPASYPLENGGRSIAMVAGLPIEMVQDSLVLKDNGSAAYSHVIRKDGSFVFKSLDSDKESYYDWLESEATDDDKTPEAVIQGIKDAIAEGGEYYAALTADNERRNIYCVPLQKTEWILVTVMPHGPLDEIIDDLGQTHQRDAVLACGILLIVLFVIFLGYFWLSMERIEKLRKAQMEAERASKAKSEFLSNMSHDIRTPMNAIVGMTTIASSNIEKKELVEDCLKKITLSSKHLLGLINDVLDMSKIESGKLTLSMEEISLRETMEGVVNINLPQIKEKQQSFDIFIHDIQCEEVFCDSVRLNQILLNLLSNAVKFTPPGGTINIMLSQEDSPKGADYVRNHIRVKDNGIGMTEDFREKIFDVFSREDNKRVSRTEGSGLGMAITKHIVDQMQGTIEVESKKNKGSEFHIVLDLEKAPAREEDMHLPAWNILVLDDDEQLCRGAVGSLETLGVRAEYASEYDVAVDMAAQRHTEGKDYQVILVDWKMPDMDGIEVARLLRGKISDKTRILLVSAYDWTDIEEVAYEAGINGFLSKPLFKSTLFYGLQNCMGIGNGDNNAPDVGEENKEKKARRLLVAEDYDMNWDILEVLLPDQGYEIERAENGQVCVDKFMDAQPGYYNGILMDLRMPVMDGYEATAVIRSSKREDANIPIIAMTADAFLEDVQRCLSCGMNSHVAKPINMHELLNTLDKFL